MIRGNQNYYFHKDALGSVIALSDESGDVIQQYVYDAYGEIKIYNGENQEVTTSPIKNPYTYTGREFDEETGFYYYRARYYDANTGRFLSQDPLSFRGGGFNLYQYVLGNPINSTDPTGLAPSGGTPGSSGTPGVGEGLLSLIGGILAGGVVAGVGQTLATILTIPSLGAIGVLIGLRITYLAFQEYFKVQGVTLNGLINTFFSGEAGRRSTRNPSQSSANSGRRENDCCSIT